MIVITHRFKFDECDLKRPTTFDRLRIGTFFMVYLHSLDDSASVNIKLSAEYAVVLKTGNCFKLPASTLVCIGSCLND